MARLATVGFETEPVTAGDEATYSPTFEGGKLGTGTWTKDTGVKRSGTASRKFDSGAGNLAVSNRLQWFGVLGRGVYARGYFRVTSLPSSSAYIARLSTGSNFVLIQLKTTGKIAGFDPSAVQIGSDSAATVAVDTWYRLEVYGLAGTGAVDDVEVRLDGVTVCSATDQAYQEAAIDRFDVGWLAAPGANKSIYWDDVAINDDTGTSNNSWPGEGSIVYLNAVADSAVTGSWTAGGGGGSNLFEAVNNDPPAGLVGSSATDTSQIRNNNTADATGNYDATMESYATAGLTDDDLILMLQPVFQSGTSTSATVTAGAQMVSNPSRSEDSFLFGRAAIAGTYPVNWRTEWADTVTQPSVVMGTQPVLRVGRRGTEASEAYVCGMRIAVEYLPGGATGLAWITA